MQEILFFPPDKLRVTSQKISTILEGFDLSRLPETDRFRYGSIRRKSMRIQVGDLTYRALTDHCDFYGKSFSTAIMQRLALVGFPDGLARQDKF
jgi:hypothetical protein